MTVSAQPTSDRASLGPKHEYGRGPRCDQTLGGPRRLFLLQRAQFGVHGSELPFEPRDLGRVVRLLLRSRQKLLELRDFLVEHFHPLLLFFVHRAFPPGQRQGRLAA